MGRFDSFEHREDWEPLTDAGTKRQDVRITLADMAKKLKKRWIMNSRTIRAKDGQDIQVYRMVQE